VVNCGLIWSYYHCMLPSPTTEIRTDQMSLQWSRDWTGNIYIWIGYYPYFWK
jgi:hypothetical protein